jgi:hypothetical protein
VNSCNAHAVSVAKANEVTMPTSANEGNYDPLRSGAGRSSSHSRSVRRHRKEKVRRDPLRSCGVAACILQLAAGVLLLVSKLADEWGSRFIIWSDFCYIFSLLGVVCCALVGLLLGMTAVTLGLCDLGLRPAGSIRWHAIGLGLASFVLLGLLFGFLHWSGMGEIMVFLWMARYL